MRVASMLAKMKLRNAAVLLLGSLTLFGCNSKGTCEYKFDEASKDGSIPAGLEVCEPETVPDVCNEKSVSQHSMGLKTSGFSFTKGAKCDERGYKDCSGGRNISFYKTCPGNKK
jgi:hypothetical protein